MRAKGYEQPASTTCSKRKVMNYLVKKYPGKMMSLKLDIHNYHVNERLRGCSGFITDEKTGNTMYFSTDRGRRRPLEYMYRSAENNKDFTGGLNQYGKSMEDMIDQMMNQLELGKWWGKEEREEEEVER